MFENILSLFRSKKPCVHLYALCWNDEKMLPFFFRHYDQTVTKYFIYDNGSSDRSLELLRKHKRVEVGKFEVNGNSFVREAMDFYNRCWKQSKGKCDWVIVCNIDEHLYHPVNLSAYLHSCTRQGFTILKPEGYEMFAEEFPSAAKAPLSSLVQYGCRSIKLDKPQIFNPNHIEEIHFAPGRHTCQPVGNVAEAKNPELKLLHYKNIGLSYFLPRQNELFTGLREKDIENSWGIQYTWDDEKKISNYNQLRNEARKVI